MNAILKIFTLAAGVDYFTYRSSGIVVMNKGHNP